MKKNNGIITLALAGVLVVTATVTTVYHCNQADKVVVTEHILHGDKAEVADVTVTQYDTLSNKLIWETAIPMDDVTQSETEFSQYRERVSARQPESGHLDVQYSLNMSGGTSGTFDFNDDEKMLWGYPIEMLQDVASRVPVGEEYTEEVHVADYGDYYIPEVYVDFPADSQVEQRYLFEDEGGTITDYFRIPVEEDDIATVTMIHDGYSGINDITINLEREDIMEYIRMASVFVGDTIYCGTAMENGTQIHRIDCAPKSEGSNQMEVLSIAPVGEIPETMLGFYESLILREGGEQMFLLCGDEEDQLEKIAVISIENMEVEQVLPLENFDYYRTYQGEDHVIFHSYEGDFVVYEEENGHYTKALEGNYATYADMEEVIRQVTAMDYREGKLITAFRSGRSTEMPRLYVSANTVQGCVFTGEYFTSLSEDVPYISRVGNWVQQWDSKKLEIVREG